MMNSLCNMLGLNLSRRFQQTLLVGVLSTVGALSGLSINPTGEFSVSMGSAVYAQDNTQLAEYAKIVYAIEQLRRPAYQEAKRMMGGELPKDVCTQQQTPVPQSVRSICNNFFEKSDQILQRSKLKRAEFNEMTRRQQSDPTLQKLIQDQLIKIQRDPALQKSIQEQLLQ